MQPPVGPGQNAAEGSAQQEDGLRRVHMRVVGRVQGVGFRWTCRKVAVNLGLTGWVRNEYDGSVSLELQGPSGAIAVFFTHILHEYKNYPIHYHIEEKDDIPLKPREKGFSVLY